ncbi:hypothetical protein STEG23_000342, partial [Scotinomys teguina]
MQTHGRGLGRVECKGIAAWVGVEGVDGGDQQIDQASSQANFVRQQAAFFIMKIDIVYV